MVANQYKNLTFGHFFALICLVASHGVIYVFTAIG